MRLLWNMWVDAKTEEKALKLCCLLLERLEKETSGKKVEPYPKTGGFVVSFATNLESARWNDAVVEAIALGERAGHGWMLTGSVHDQLSGWSNEANISGVVSIEWTLLRGAASGAD